MTFVRLIRVLTLAGLLVTSVESNAETNAATAVSTQVRQVLSVQVEAWNHGDIQGFMQTYAPVEDLRFATGNTVTYGWKSTLLRYQKRYPDRAAMGRLSFSELTVTELSPEAALVFGRWQLNRATDTPKGLFTLLVRKTPAGWRIFADHTSSAGP